MNTDSNRSQILVPVIVASLLAIGGAVAAVLVVRKTRERRLQDASSDAEPADVNDALPLPNQDGEWLRMRETIRVDAPPADVYEYWSDPDNLAHVMSRVDSIDTDDGEVVDTLTWRQRGPMGLYTAEWDAEVIAADHGRKIAWRSMPDSKVPNAGQVTFAPIDGETATAVTFSTAFQPPAGRVGAFFARTFYPMLRRQVRGDLFRVKYDVETLHQAVQHPAAEA